MIYNKLVKTIAISTLCIQVANAVPPMPPKDKRWVRNEKFSDEFNGEKLDSTKWFDHHPNWAGRVPGIFLPSQVSVSDGFMKIQSKKLEENIVKGKAIYTTAGGAVTSKTTDAFYGYYECRFKAAATTMSTTFWLSSRRQTRGPNTDIDSYALELDIQECIGREGNFTGKHFASGMSANSHFWYRPESKEAQDLRAEEVNFESHELASAAFNTYGGWWHNASKATFYYNNGVGKEMIFYDKVKKKPFDHSMGLNMVSETYPFPWIELPNKKELNDPKLNTCYYDWVRSYTLIDAKAPHVIGANEMKPKMVKLYGEKIIPLKTRNQFPSSNNLTIPFAYMANSDRLVHVKFTDEKGKVLANAIQKAHAGYANTKFNISLKEPPAPGIYCAEFTLENKYGGLLGAKRFVRIRVVKAK